ncbi:MAG: hypothetical protein P4L57_15485 [Rhizomicrobium sp.]|nr:hypothetical protein [Rhizomicrobium sp.]
MSSDIGYGASAIKAGETRYQQAVVNLLKDAAKKTDAAPSTIVDTPAHVGKNLDVNA